jgi:hypothetical protein
MAAGGDHLGVSPTGIEDDDAVRVSAIRLLGAGRISRRPSRCDMMQRGQRRVSVGEHAAESRRCAQGDGTELNVDGGRRADKVHEPYARYGHEHGVFARPDRSTARVSAFAVPPT